MSIVRGIRKAASGPGAALGGVLTSSSVYGPDGFLDVENISLSRDRAMKLSTVNRCVEVRSCTVAALPVYLMRESTKERLRDHRLAKVLWGRPNEAMTRFDYERLMQVNLDLRGNAYAWISRDPRTGYPVELIPLQPDHVTPYVALDSSLWYIYTNPRTGEMFRLSPADVLHYLPVTNELLEDSDSNIAAVAEEWLGDEARVTANKEIMTIVATNDSTDLKDLDGILKAWIGLGSTFRATSKLLTNDDGLTWLGTLKDTNGRYLLSPNPADPKQLQLCVGPHILPVKTYDNDTIPSTGTKIPFILGDLMEGIAYWDRRQFTIKVSDVATVGELNAFEQDLTIWRGSLRDDCTSWDDEAWVNGYIDTAAAAG